jgi:hypothetical protein
VPVISFMLIHNGCIFFVVPIFLVFFTCFRYNVAIKCATVTPGDVQKNLSSLIYEHYYLIATLDTYLNFDLVPHYL